MESLVNEIICPFDMECKFKKADLTTLCETKNGYLTGKYFYSLSNPGIYYYIRIFPNGDQEERRGETMIFLHINSVNEKKIEADFTVTIESANYTKHFEYVFERNIGLGNFCSKTSEFFDSTNNFFVKDKFTIKVKGIIKTVRSSITELLSPFSTEWKLKKTDLMALKDSENAIEKYVYDANIPGLRYYIRIYPNGFNEESRGETWILLNVNGSNEKKIAANFTVSVESANFYKNICKIYEKFEGFSIYCSKSTDFFKSTKNFFVNGEITLKIEGISKSVRTLIHGIESPLDIECKFKKFDLMELSDSEGGFLFGKCFYVFNNPGIQYYIEICKTGDKDEERRGETWIFLRMNGSAKRNITTEFTISVESANFSRNLYHVYETHEAWGIACCKTVDFFDTNRKFFVDGEITVKVKGFLKAERSLKIPCPISMQWKIKEDDLKAKKESNGYLRSKRFNILSFSNVKYFLSVYPNFKKVKNLAETHLFLNIELGAEKAVEAMYDFSIETANFCYITQYIFQKSTGIGTILCPVDDLFNKFKGYIVDGFLTINFNGILMIEKDRAALELNCINGLEIDAMQCYQEKDFTIIVGEKEIKAHKKVLMNASPVFTGMFESGMKESIENKMVIEEEEFSFEVVDTAIKLCYNTFFYVDFNLEDMLSLFRFADRYDIKNITGSVEDCLIKRLSSSNVCQLKKFSTTFNAKKLHQSCIDFLIKCLEGRTPVLGSDSLDKDFVFSLFSEALCPVVESDIDV